MWSLNTTRLSRHSFLKLTAGIAATGAITACVAPEAAGTDGPSAVPTVVTWARPGSEGNMGPENGLAELFQTKHPNIEVDPMVLP